MSLKALTLNEFDNMNVLDYIRMVRENVEKPCKEIVNEDIAYGMMQLIQDVLSNKKTRICDIYCKSGVFLFVAIKLYMKMLSSSIHDRESRYRYIVRNCIYGVFSNNDDAYFVSRVLGMPMPNYITIDLDSYDYTGIEKEDSKETRFKMYSSKCEVFLKMVEADVVVLNPPYNKGMDLDFIKIAYKSTKRYVVAIAPAKWQTTADDYKGCESVSTDYKEFRSEMVPYMSYVCFYLNCKDIFDIYQPDGITYYLLDKEHTGDCTVENKCQDIKEFNNIMTRSITNKETLNNIGYQIITELGEYEKFKFPNVTGSKRYSVRINKKIGGYNWYATHKPRAVFSVSRVLDTAKGETYDGESSVIFESDSFEQCRSFLSFIYSSITRLMFVFNISKLNNAHTDDCYRFVIAPVSGEDGTLWNHMHSDEEIYAQYPVLNKYRDIIDKVISKQSESKYLTDKDVYIKQ